MTAMALNVLLPFGISEEDVKLLLAMKLFEVGKVSLGQAAQLAGFTKRAFIDVLGQQHIPVCNYPAEDLRQELAA